MLEVLLESRAVRAKRMGGTLTSVLVHGAMIAGIVTLSVKARPVEAHVPDVPKGGITYLPVKPPSEAPKGRVTRTLMERHDTPKPIQRQLPTIERIPTGIPPVDLTSGPITDATEFTRRLGQEPGGTGRPGLAGPIEGVLDERYVD